MSESSRKRKHKRSSKEEETYKNQLHSDRSKRRHNDKYSSHSKRHEEQASHVEKESRQITKSKYKLCSREDKDKRRRVSQTDVVDSKTNSASHSQHNSTPLKAECRSVRKADVANGKEIKELRTRSRSPNIRNSDTDHRKKEKSSIYSSDKNSLHVSKSKSQTDVLDSKINSASDSQHNNTPLKLECMSVPKADVANGSEIKELRTRSRSPNIRSSDTDHRRKEKCSIYSSDKNSLHVSTSKSKKMGTSPTYASEERGKNSLGLLKSKQKDLEIQTPRNDSKTAEKKESKTGIVKVTSHESGELLVKEKNIFDRKKFTDSTKQHCSISTKPKVSFKIAKSLHAIPKIFSPPTPVHSNFKIPKKVKPGLAETNTTETSDVTKTSKTDTCTSEHPVLEASTNSVAVLSSFLKPFERKDESPSSSSAPATSCDAIAEETSEQMQVAEKLHLARTERRLEVDIMQSYGELTCMDIDPAEESTTYSLSKEPAQQAVILVLDTNILLSHLDYVKNIQKRGVGALGIPVVLIPWVVLQELDSLKKGKGFKDCVAHLACPAISYIYNSLKRRDPHLWGQSMQQAAQSNNSLMAENNDDKVLQCCLQYQSLYPGRVLILCTNDKNLCTKAVLSGVKALSKIDLEAEVEHSQHNRNYLQSTVLQRLPQINMPMCLPIPERRCTQAPSLTEIHLSLCLPEDERKTPAVEETKINKCVSEFEECLQEVLSNVLEMEMKASFDDLWKEIIYKPPPWNLHDILQCFKKHWIAVFGFIVPRFLLQTVLNLINFFRQGHSKDLSSTLLTLQEAREFVKAFGKRSKHVPKALTAMEKIVQKLQTEPESDVCDVVMNEEDEAKQPPSAHVPHHEVWAMFENIWCKVCEISLEVFKALAFDPHTRQSALSVGGPAPPQDAMLCLSQISSTVSQLLQAFISVLSPSPGLQEVQVLLSMIRSNKMVNVDFRLVDTDLLSCFSQQDYRDKLRVGVNQLKELKDALDHCVQVMGLQVSLNM
ncbi:transcriptional protein SWT1 [Stigmatopora argus]